VLKRNISEEKMTMDNSIEIIRKEAQSTSTWSGGTTTQLAIYPESSDYKMRNFLWRLSSARVDIEESTFTSLPGIWRHIMIIEGEMKLMHEGHHSILLKPFEQDSFSGDWVTKSRGQVRDFNLMLAQGCKGRLEAVRIDKAVNINLALDPPDTGYMNSADAFYCAAGEVSMKIEGYGLYALYAGDLLIVRSTESKGHEAADIKCTNCDDAVIIRAGIQF
jgi:environmental stress-induced protein Ves